MSNDYAFHGVVKQLVRRIEISELKLCVCEQKKKQEKEKKSAFRVQLAQLRITGHISWRQKCECEDWKTAGENGNEQRRLEWEKFGAIYRQK